MTTLPLNMKLLARAALGAGSAAAISAALSMGCSSDDSTPAADSGGPTTPDAGSDAGSLYARLGGHAGIRAAVNQIVADETANMDIASYFFFQGGAPGNGHPTVDQVEECFTDLIGSLTGGAEMYPMTITTDAGAYTCRDMQTIHAPLLISSGTFDEFVMIAGMTLGNLGVTSGDVMTLAGALSSTKSAIVPASLMDSGLQAYPGDGG
jgi:hypothetical protein